MRLKPFAVECWPAPNRPDREDGLSSIDATSAVVDLGGSVPSLSGHDKADGVLSEIEELKDAAQAVERLLLHLVAEAPRGAVPFDNLAGELELLAKNVMRNYRRVVYLKARRDLGFGAVTQLNTLGAHYIWLFRRAHLERLFYTKLHLEAELRTLVSDEAFEIYQRLLGADEQEQEVVSRDDAEIAALLLGERPTSLPVSAT